MSSPPILELNQLTKAFGGLVAVNQVDLSVPAGAIVGLIGPNGSGKSTTLNLISGLYTPSSGTIRLAGQDVTRQGPSARTGLGLARTFQNIRLFSRMTVQENVATACYCRTSSGLLQVVLRTPRMQEEEREIQRQAAAALELIGLSEKAAAHPGDLPYGQQRLVEIARALASKPKVLLLDEPAAGLNPSEKQALMALIRRLNTELGLTILLVEHDMHMVMNICHRITVLNFGARIAEGTAAEVRQDPEVIRAYLGRGEGHAAAL